jgi:hypothetical protein
MNISPPSDRAATVQFSMLPATTVPATPAAWTMQFDVSLNEEHVFLTLLDEGAHCIDLGERVHHYSLLVLARLRLADAARGIETGGQGWVDNERLLKMLGVDGGHLNIQLFRARRQIMAALPAAPELVGVIERRRGEIRFGEIGVRIFRGATLEAQSSPSWFGADAVMLRNRL